MTDRWLPGVPGREIERIFNAAAGNEIASREVRQPGILRCVWLPIPSDSSSTGPRILPPLPDCSRVVWPARSLSLEEKVHFP